MHRALWVAKKNQICVLIKKISDFYGGDDIDWLREYCRDVIEMNKDNLDELLSSCLDMESRLV